MELTPAKLCRGKIDRSAEALRVRHHPVLFPSENRLCDNTTRVITRTKKQRVAFKKCQVLWYQVICKPDIWNLAPIPIFGGSLCVESSDILGRMMRRPLFSM